MQTRKKNIWIKKKKKFILSWNSQSCFTVYELNISCANDYDKEAACLKAAMSDVIHSHPCSWRLYLSSVFKRYSTLHAYLFMHFVAFGMNKHLGQRNDSLKMTRRDDHIHTVCTHSNSYLKGHRQQTQIIYLLS